jgi:hypothetical protein
VRTTVATYNRFTSKQYGIWMTAYVKGLLPKKL